MKASTKSLILASLVVAINMVAYFSFRLIFFKEISFAETFGYTIWVSILDFTIVYLVTLFFFKIQNGK